MNATGNATASTSPGSHESATELIEQRAERRIAEFGCYAHFFKDVSLRIQNGVLILTGSVPTFYLKQVLQTLLKDLERVSRIDNHVEVVNSRGLSSVRAK